jgi:RNA polymerase sigma factor (sigma-70 family)
MLPNDPRTDVVLPAPPEMVATDEAATVEVPAGSAVEVPVDVATPVVPAQRQDERNGRDERTRACFAETLTCSPERRSVLLDEIVTLHMGVARSIAVRYRDRGVALDDLVQVAYLGLTKAARGFDPEHGGTFLAYAVPTITGEVRRYFRDHAWQVRPPRRIQELQAEISRVRADAMRAGNASPTVNELVAKLDADADTVIEALGADGCFQPAALDMPNDEGHTLMKAVTWHGKRDVRVEEVPDPTIQEPTDADHPDHDHRTSAAPTCTCTRCSARSWTEPATSSATSRWASSRRSAARSPTWRPATASSSRSRSPAVHCWMCDQGLYTQCETTQVREQGMGAALFGYTKLYGRCRAARPSTCACRRRSSPIKVPDGPPDDRFVYLSDVLPTAWQAVEYAGPRRRHPRRARPRPDRRHGVPHRQHKGLKVIGVDLVPEAARARPGARRRGRRPSKHDIGDAVREPDRRPGPDAVIDAVGMEAHGSPVTKLAHTRSECCPTLAEPVMSRRPASTGWAPCTPPSTSCARRHDLAVSGRLRRRGRPDAAAHDVRQADPAADGPGQRHASGATTSCRCSPTTTRSASTASPPTGCRSARHRTRTRCSRRRRTARSRCCSSRS